MCTLCNADNLTALKGIAEALVAGTLADLQHLNLYNFDQLDYPENVANSLNQLVQKISEDHAGVEIFPKNSLTLAEVSKNEFGRDTHHMQTFVFKPAGSEPPTYFGLGGHNEGVALFDHASDEVLSKREAAAAALRAKLDRYTTIGSQRERVLTQSLRARLMQVLETTKPTDEQQALLKLALGKDWQNTVRGSGRISARTILGLLELFGQTKNPAFAEDVQ